MDVGEQTRHGKEMGQEIWLKDKTQEEKVNNCESLDFGYLNGITGSNPVWRRESPYAPGAQLV